MTLLEYVLIIALALSNYCWWVFFTRYRGTVIKRLAEDSTASKEQL